MKSIGALLAIDRMNLQERCDWPSERQRARNCGSERTDAARPARPGDVLPPGWPNSKVIERFDLINLVTSADRVFVTYEGRNTNGHRFRNTEILSIRGQHIVDRWRAGRR
jgi:hypothetical protein